MVSLVFTDECGAYQAKRSRQFNVAHPFYVRASVMIPAEAYAGLDEKMVEAKNRIGIEATTELKWSHYGNLLKNNANISIRHLTVQDIQAYISEIVNELCVVKKVKIFYTVTDNRIAKNIDEVKLIKMHIQNALQRADHYANETKTFAFVIADDLNSKTKNIKSAVRELTVRGDQYVKYKNINKGLFVDVSDQCVGLQIADLCAGIFAASLKYLDAEQNDKYKFEWAYNLLMDVVYKKIRNSISPPHFDVYRYGIREVPDGAGREIACKISRCIEKKIEMDFLEELKSLG